MQDDTLEPQPGTRLGAVLDDRGALVERQTLVMAERTLLCEVNLYVLYYVALDRPSRSVNRHVWPPPLLKAHGKCTSDAGHTYLYRRV